MTTRTAEWPAGHRAPPGGSLDH